MSDTPPPPPPLPEEPSVEQENKLTSDQFEEFKEALEILYVIANLSGRNQFTKAWPHAAAHIFGPELIKYDEEGTDDKEHRAELEAQAEERRIELLEFMDSIEEKSVDKGALQMDYVREAVTGFGRDLALLIYGPKIVDRFLPPPPDASPPEEGSAEVSDAPQEPAPPPEQPEQEKMPEMPVDPMDNIKPIDMDMPPSETAAPVPPPAAPAPAAPPPVQPPEEQGMGQPTVPPVEPPSPPPPPPQPPPNPPPTQQAPVAPPPASETSAQAESMTFVSSNKEEPKKDPAQGSEPEQGEGEGQQS